MTSPPSDVTHGRTSLGVAYHHHLPWTAHTVERRRAWHDITAIGIHAQSDDVKRGMTSPPLDSTHGRNDVGHGMPSSPLGSIHSRTTLGVACHLGPWTTYTVERHQAWHAIIAFKPADTVRRRRAWHAIIAQGRHSRMTSRVACHNRLLKAHTVGRRRAWHAIISFGQHRPSDGVRRGMPTSPLGSTNDRPSSGVACHHSPWTAHTVGNVGQGIKSPPLDSTHGQTTSSMA